MPTFVETHGIRVEHSTIKTFTECLSFLAIYSISDNNNQCLCHGPVFTIAVHLMVILNLIQTSSISIISGIVNFAFISVVSRFNLMTLMARVIRVNVISDL